MGFLSSLGKVAGVGSLIGGIGGALSLTAVGAPLVASTQLASAQKESIKLQQEANRIQQASASVEQARRRRAAVAQARILRAENIASAIATGGQGGLSSSGFQGAQAGIASTTAAGINSLNRTFASQQATFDLRQQAEFVNAAGQRKAGQTQAIGSSINTGLNFAAQLI